MAKERKTSLAAVPSPVAATDAQPAPQAAAPPAVAATPAVRTRAPRKSRGSGRAPDPRESRAAAALYARIPSSTKRNLDIAAAMTGADLATVVSAILGEYVDPQDPGKMDTLARLLDR